MAGSGRWAKIGPVAHVGWLRSLRGSVDDRRERNRLVGWIVHAKRWEVVVAAIALYGALAVGFGLLYWATDGLNKSDIGSALYFSVVTQATVGYGDVVATGPGRFLVVGRGLVDGVVEVKDRRTGDRVDVAVGELVAHLR